ncbi:MAG: hypothetical protein N2316_13005, partial [Spirochaetes bacterium]|nr:hypothetical protein [Spirochaetota bacterium]
MSTEQLDSINKRIVAIERQFTERLIANGKMRNVDVTNRLSLIAAELLTNEEISENIYFLAEHGV